jgi:hypothetical protein
MSRPHTPPAQNRRRNSSKSLQSFSEYSEMFFPEKPAEEAGLMKFSGKGRSSR